MRGMGGSEPGRGSPFAIEREHGVRRVVGRRWLGPWGRSPVKGARPVARGAGRRCREPGRWRVGKVTGAASPARDAVWGHTRAGKKVGRCEDPDPSPIGIVPT